MIMAKTRDYIAYYRVSTQRQGTSGLGLEAQRKAVVDYINGNGSKVLAEYTEVESGKRWSRPELDKALAHCKKHRATLVIAKLDRLARNVHFISGLIESRVDFVAADMPEADRAFLQMAAVFAEWEGRKISERTKAALAAAKARGVKLGITGKDRATENKAAADAVARSLRPVIKEIAAEGITTIRGVAEALNIRNIPTPRGGRWHATSVARLLARLA